jgi:hypothetical protein
MSSARKLLFGGIVMERYPAIINQKFFHSPGKYATHALHGHACAESACVLADGLFSYFSLRFPTEEKPTTPEGVVGEIGINDR